MLFLVLVADFFVVVFNRFLFFRFSLVSVFFVSVLVFVNGIVIFSFLVIFVFVFVNENHTAVRGEPLMSVTRVQCDARPMQFYSHTIKPYQQHLHCRHHVGNNVPSV